MKLRDVCEPLFQYICRISRSARQGAQFDTVRIRSDIDRLFERMRAGAAEDAVTVRQFERVELPLVFFVDYMIKEGPFDFASNWQEIAFEKHEELAGDERFFDILEEICSDNHPESLECLEVMHTCLGLGFEGFYKGQQEQIRRKMQQVWTRLRDQGVTFGERGRMALAGESAMHAEDRLCPEAYTVDQRTLPLEIGNSLMLVVVVLAGMLVGLFFFNAYLYRSTSSDLRESLEQINQSAASVSPSPEDSP